MYNNTNSSAKSSEVLPVVRQELWGIYRMEGGAHFSGSDLGCPV